MNQAETTLLRGTAGRLDRSFARPEKALERYSRQGQEVKQNMAPTTTQTLPETVTVPSGAAIEMAATLLAGCDILARLDGTQDEAPNSVEQRLSKAAWTLLDATELDGAYFSPNEHPVLDRSDALLREWVTALFGDLLSDDGGDIHDRVASIETQATELDNGLAAALGEILTSSETAI